MSKLCLIGVGNPGAKYDGTRHNIGKEWLLKLAASKNIQFSLKDKLEAAITSSDEDNILWAIPNNFVNNTGSSIQKIIRYSNLNNEDLIIFHDDLDLNPGEIKIKSGGGHGGHNGLNDIFKKIGTKDFFRVRIGIGHPGKENDVTGWVLGKPNQEDKNLIEKSYGRLESVFDLLCNKEFSEAQLKLHTK